LTKYTSVGLHFGRFLTNLSVNPGPGWNYDWTLSGIFSDYFSSINTSSRYVLCHMLNCPYHISFLLSNWCNSSELYIIVRKSNLVNGEKIDLLSAWMRFFTTNFIQHKAGFQSCRMIDYFKVNPSKEFCLYTFASGIFDMTQPPAVLPARTIFS
jgi:hypothetical protein